MKRVAISKGPHKVQITHSKGFVRIYRDLLKYVEQGVIDFVDFSVFNWLQCKADYETGLVNSTNATHVSQQTKLPYKKTAEAFKNLDNLGLITRFYERGKRGGFPVLIDGFLVKTGNTFKVVDASATTEIKDIKYKNINGLGNTMTNTLGNTSENTLGGNIIKKNKKGRIEKTKNQNLDHFII